jgi:hypothetical protein
MQDEPDHSAIPSHEYDPERPQYISSDNGDGSLFCVGTATPSDFDEFGIILGPRPSQIQLNSANIESAIIPPQSTPRSPSELNTLATQESDDTSIESLTQKPKILPAKEAMIENV